MKTKKKKLTLKLLGEKIFYLLLLLLPLGFFLGKYFEKHELPFFPQPVVKPRVSWLKTEGRNITDANGKVMVLRGVNLASLSWEEENWHPKAVEKAFTDWQVNIIRTRLMESEYKKDKAEYLEKVDKLIINPARKYGLYVILQTQFDDPRDSRVKNDLANDDNIKMWQAVAQKYHDDPTVLYDPLAEPRNVTPDVLRENYLKIIKAIREINPDSLIFVTGLGWGRYLNFWLDNPLSYPNIVYRSNSYNKKGEFEGLFGEIAQRYPVFIGEFGAEAQPYMSFEDVKFLLEYTEKLQLGWTAWNFSNSGCPCLLDNKNDFSPTPYGQMVKTSLEQTAKNRTTYTLLPQASPRPLLGDLLIIYDEGLKNGFVDYSWDTETKILDNTQAFQGQYSLSFKFLQDFSALFLSRLEPFEIQDFKTLHFCLNGMPTDLELQIWGSQEQKLKIEKISNLKSTKSGQWQCYDYDLSFLKPAEAIKGFVFQTKKSFDSPLFLDQMYLGL